MKNRAIRICAAACLFTTAFFSMGVRSGANSAQSYWRGTDSSGVAVSGENCPITVTHETLTFDIERFPSSYYSDLEELSEYDARVTASYEFYNPSDMTVDAKLVFPFGTFPDYVNLYSVDGEYLSMPTDKYGVKVNGESVECNVRHTYSGYLAYYGFKLSEDMPKLHDGFRSDEFFTRDTPVYRQSYVIESTQSRSIMATFIFDSDVSRTRVLACGNNGFGCQSVDGGTQVDIWTTSGETIDLYFFGEAPSGDMDFKFYTDGTFKKEIDGSAARVDKPCEFNTFYDFAMQSYDESYGVSESDWYNAVLDCLDADDSQDRGVYLINDLFDAEYFRSTLLNWFEYEISLEPGETLTNDVTAPLYPSIESDFEPPVYEYTYLLSPARSWASFGTLDIYVNTPYYIVESKQFECSIDGFEKTENGYEAHLSSLPNVELIFSLSDSESPKRSVSPYTVFGIILIVVAIILLPITLICILVTWIVGLVDNAKN